LEWDRHPADTVFTVPNTRDPFGRGNIPFNIDFPVDDQQTAAHQAWAETFVRSVNTAIISRNWASIAPLIDVPTFVDMYLVHELFKNRDFGYSSLFFQIKHKPSPKLIAGPVWDFDQSAGSVVDAPQYPDYSPTGGDYPGVYTGAWAAYDNPWWRDLMLIPEFQKLVVARWNEIRNDQVESMIRQIRPIATFYSNCFNRNFTEGGLGSGMNRASWTAMSQPDTGLWRTPNTIRNITTFMGQVNYLVNWFEQRRIWMDGYMASLAQP